MRHSNPAKLNLKDISRNSSYLTPQKTYPIKTWLLKTWLDPWKIWPLKKHELWKYWPRKNLTPNIPDPCKHTTLKHQTSENQRTETPGPTLKPESWQTRPLKNLTFDKPEPLKNMAPANSLIETCFPWKTLDYKNCHCLYHAQARIEWWHACSLLITSCHQFRDVHLIGHTCAAEIQLVPILAKHHKLPTHLQFYCIFKSVELSWAQFDYIVCEGSWWFHREIRTLNSRIKVQASNPSTNNDIWKKELISMPYILP